MQYDEIICTRKKHSTEYHCTAAQQYCTAVVLYWKSNFNDFIVIATYSTLKTRGSSEAVLEQEDTSKVVQCFSYSIASFVPLVFNTQPTKSGLHTFPLRLANQLVGVTTQYSFISVRAGATCVQYRRQKHSSSSLDVIEKLHYLHSLQYAIHYWCS